jgi:hypothetical protein
MSPPALGVLRQSAMRFTRKKHHAHSRPLPRPSLPRTSRWSWSPAPTSLASSDAPTTSYPRRVAHLPSHRSEATPAVAPLTACHRMESTDQESTVYSFDCTAHLDHLHPRHVLQMQCEGGAPAGEAKDPAHPSAAPALLRKRQVRAPCTSCTSILIVICDCLRAWVGGRADGHPPDRPPIRRRIKGGGPGATLANSPLQRLTTNQTQR